MFEAVCWLAGGYVVGGFIKDSTEALTKEGNEKHLAGMFPGFMLFLIGEAIYELYKQKCKK